MTDRVIVVREPVAVVRVTAPGPPGPPGGDGPEGPPGQPGVEGPTGPTGVVSATAPATYDAPTRAIGVLVGTTPGTVAAGDDSRFADEVADRVAGDAATLEAAASHADGGDVAEAASRAAGDTAEAAARSAADALLTPLAQRGAPNGVATLDAGSRVPAAQLPAIAITDTFPVASQAAMLALPAQRGDVAVRSDVRKSLILAADDPTALADWQELLTPADVVTSVDGLTGAVVLPADAAAATPSLRTLGPGGQQAVAGNDARLADQRVPVDGSVTIPKLSFDPATQAELDAEAAARAAADATKANDASVVHVTGTETVAGAKTFTGGVVAQAPTVSAAAVIKRALAAQVGDIDQWQSSAAAVLASVGPDGSMRSPSFGSVTPLMAVLMTNYDAGGLAVLTQADANKGLVLRRNSATQSANPLEWQDQLGAVMGFVGPGGRMGLGTSVDIGGQLGVRPNTASGVGLVVRAQAAQTGDIVQAQDSAATVLASISSGGIVRSSQFQGNASNLPYAQPGTLGWLFRSNSASRVTVKLQAEPSQSADILQITDSGGGVLARVLAGGGISVLGSAGYGFGGSSGVSGGMFTSGSNLAIRAAAPGATVWIQDSSGANTYTFTPALLTMPGGLSFAPTTTLVAPAAGAAGVLPALPAGYATVTIGGVARQLAYY
jgi:hypothetical protein